MKQSGYVISTITIILGFTFFLGSSNIHSSHKSHHAQYPEYKAGKAISTPRLSESYGLNTPLAQQPSLQLGSQGVLKLREEGVRKSRNTYNQYTQKATRPSQPTATNPNYRAASPTAQHTQTDYARAIAQNNDNNYNVQHSTQTGSTNQYIHATTVTAVATAQHAQQQNTPREAAQTSNVEQIVYDNLDKHALTSGATRAGGSITLPPKPDGGGLNPGNQLPVGSGIGTILFLSAALGLHQRRRQKKA